MTDPTGKKADLAIAVFVDRRSEIRDRLGYRDQWLSRYVFGVVAFLGVSLGVEQLTVETRILLCLVMPIISYIVAVNVSAHVTAVEDSANYIRGDLNKYFIDQGIWIPHWDWRTSIDRRKVDVQEKNRNISRRWANVLSLHLPSIISLFAATTIILDNYRFCLCRDISQNVTIVYIFAMVSVLLAIKETWSSFQKRINKTVHAATPLTHDASNDRQPDKNFAEAVKASSTEVDAPSITPNESADRHS